MPTYSTVTMKALELLGDQVRLARVERRWTLRELADRVGVNEITARKVERGDPSVRLGVALECAVVLGVPIFDQDPRRVDTERRLIAERLALLPQRVRRPSEVDDDF